MSSSSGIRVGTARDPLGFEATLRLFQTRIDRTSADVERMLTEMARLIYEWSQYYCPIDSGRLRSEATWGITEGLDRTGYNLQAQVSYNTFYATYVHQRLDQYHEPPTQAKFLERAVATVWADLSALAGKTFQVEYGAFDVGGFLPPGGRGE